MNRTVVLAALGGALLQAGSLPTICSISVMSSPRLFLKIMAGRAYLFFLQCIPI